MNNAKMWLVVKPTVGVPLFLSAVAIGSFAVHVAVLTNTSWVGDFLKGNPLGSGDEMAMNAEPVDGTILNQASYVANGVGAHSDKVIVELPDGRLAVATIDALPVIDGAPNTAITH